MKDTKKETKLVPKLRFREFTDTWLSRKLDTVFDHIGGTALEKYVNPQGSYNFISIGNYTTDGKYNDTGARIVLNEKTKTKLLEQGNLAMVLNDKTASGDIIGSSILIDNNDKYIYNQRTERLIVKEGVPSFLWHFLNSPKFRKRIYKISQGGTQIYVNYSAVEKLSIVLPQINEQQKIASFLTLIDKRIELLTKKKKLLEVYKKGVMQKIFNQEIRFKDENGNDFPEWEEKELNSLLKRKVDNRGKTPPLSKTGIPLIEINAIGSKYIDYSKVTKFVDDHTYKKWFRQHLLDGDILFSTVGATAICSQYTDSYIAVIAQNLVGLTFNIDPNFAYYLLTYPCNNRKFKRIEMVAVQPSVKVSQMIHLKFEIPSMPEQQVISKILNQLDEYESKLKLMITKLQDFKHGLLQQMFI